MLTPRLYNDDLSPEDIAAGFELLEVKNPASHLMGQPPYVPAVVFRAPPTDRIIKTNNPGGGPSTYHHQRFGHLAFQDASRAAWLPRISRSYQTPGEAKEALSDGVHETLQSIVRTEAEITPIEYSDDEFRTPPSTDVAID